MKTKIEKNVTQIASDKKTEDRHTAYVVFKTCFKEDKMTKLEDKNYY